MILEGQFEFTDADIPALKTWVKNNGGVYVSKNMGQALKAKGFKEGVHYHVQKLIPRMMGKVPVFYDPVWKGKPKIVKEKKPRKKKQKEVQPYD